MGGCRPDLHGCPVAFGPMNESIYNVGFVATLEVALPVIAADLNEAENEAVRGVDELVLARVETDSPAHPLDRGEESLDAFFSPTITAIHKLDGDIQASLGEMKVAQRAEESFAGRDDLPESARDSWSYLFQVDAQCTGSVEVVASDLAHAEEQAYQQLADKICLAKETADGKSAMPLISDMLSLDLVEPALAGGSTDVPGASGAERREERREATGATPAAPARPPGEPDVTGGFNPPANAKSMYANAKRKPRATS